ncbi:hypothetical protein KI659_06175 [Litoribacter alkaliphilus]|uniref:Uncharacterized protein n=1 Tax=Litoribacter ruber TaxID=702568 RepID=A0AAP2CHZ2_9BACT|nr:hypothetical protein [Litoribacter alkaliphilus]MBS9523601.1 hypothetical protein [Litoribacter alkaliphilus]
MNLFSVVVCIVLLINPALLRGRWEIVSFSGYDKLISSTRNQALEPDEYLKMVDNYNLYMDSTYY